MTVRLKRFKVQAPDGSYLTIEGPEDATDDELIAAAEANWQPAPEPAKMEPAPQVKGPAQPMGRGFSGSKPPAPRPSTASQGALDQPDSSNPTFAEDMQRRSEASAVESLRASMAQMPEKDRYSSLTVLSEKQGKDGDAARSLLAIAERENADARMANVMSPGLVKTYKKAGSREGEGKAKPAIIDMEPKSTDDWVGLASGKGLTKQTISEAPADFAARSAVARDTGAGRLVTSEEAAADAKRAKVEELNAGSGKGILANLESGWEGAKANWQSIRSWAAGSEAKRDTDVLAAFDAVDSGQSPSIDGSSGGAFVGSYASASPEERVAIRAERLKSLAKNQGVMNEARKLWDEYSKAASKASGEQLDFTDIQTLGGFGRFLAEKIPSGAVSTAPVIIAALVTRGSTLAAGVVGGAQATGELNARRLEYGRNYDPKRFSNPDRILEAAALESELANRQVTENAATTGVLAAPFAAADLVAGPIGRILGRAKQLEAATLGQALRREGADAAKSVGEEFLTGGFQATLGIASDVAAGQRSGELTKDDFKAILNDAAAEAAGAIGVQGAMSTYRVAEGQRPSALFARAFEQDTAERGFDPQAVQGYAASSLSPDFNDPSRIDPRIQAEQLARERAMEAARQAPKVELQQTTPLTPEQIAQMGSTVATPPLQPANGEKPQQQVPQASMPGAVPQVQQPVQAQAPLQPVQPAQPATQPAPQSGPAAANSIGVASVQQGSLADRAMAAVQPTQPAQPAQAPVTQEQPKAEPVPPAKTYATKDEALIEGARIGVTPTQTATGWTLTQPASKATEPTLADIESAPTPQELAQDAADVEALNGAYRRMNDEAVRQSTNPKEAQDIRSSLVSVVPVPTTDPVARAVRAVAGSAFGIRVVTVKGMRDSGVAWDGTKKTVYINEGLSTSETIVSTVGHEALHSLKSTRPDLYNRYQEQLLPLLRAGVVAKRQKFESGAKAKDEGLISPERATEEVLADVSGSMWLQPEFWGRVAEIDKDLFRTLRYRFMQGMTKMLKAVNAYKGQRMQIETLVKDVAAAREHTAQLWAAKAMGAKPSKAEQKIDAELDAALAGFEGEGGRVLSSRQAYEVAPDPDQKAAKAKWDSQSFGQKVERTAKLDSTYFPRIAKTIGVDPRLFSAQQTFGGYLGDVNPSVVRTNLKGDDETTVKVARALANVYDQQSVMAVLKSPSKDSMLSDAVEVELNADLTADQARAIYDAVRSAPGGKWIEGFTAVGKKMQFVNVGGAISDTQKVDFQKALEAADLPLEWKSSVVRGLNIEFIGRSGNEGDMAAGQAGIGDERAAGTGGDSSLAGLKQEFAQERLNFSRSDDAGGVGAGGRQVLAGQDGASEQAARQEQKALSDLPGYPTTPAHQGPDKRLVGVAKLYAKSAGIKLQRQPRYFKADPARGKRIADAYEAMPHAPQDPKVQEAYRNLIEQTTAQYRALEKAGYKFWLYAGDSDPYATNPWNAMRDLRANQSMGVFSTRAGFGSDAAFDPQDNPLLAATGIELPFGSPNGTKQEVLANDLFRAVHDAFGHGLEGVGFRADGEENAWQAHARLFTGSALGALTSETRGQNSWLNFGPKGDANRTAGLFDTTFADQKTGLMPEWTWREGFDGPKASRDDKPVEPDKKGDEFDPDWQPDVFYGDVEKIDDADYGSPALDKEDLNNQLREEQGLEPKPRNNEVKMEAKPDAIRASGLMLESAFPALKYEESDTGQVAFAKVDGQSYKYRVAYNQIKDYYTAYPASVSGNGKALYFPELTEQFARDFNQRLAASIALTADGYDLAKQVDKKAAARVLRTWRALGDRQDAFEMPIDVDPGFKMREFGSNFTIARVKQITEQISGGTKSPMEAELIGGRQFGFFDPNEVDRDQSTAIARIENKGDKLVFHAENMESGSGAGKVFYQVAAKIAAELGMPVIADPYGLLGVNNYRRTEQMTSAALRNKDDFSMLPGEGQRIYGWEKGKTKATKDGNLLRLLLASARNAKEILPIADQLRYDLATGNFTLNGKDANGIVKKALDWDSKPDVAATSMSRSTLARAVITFEAMQGEVSIPDSLDKPLLYSRAEETTPLDSISTDDYKAASGRELVLEGDDGSSLRIDAAVLFKDFQSRRELAKTVLDCLA